MLVAPVDEGRDRPIVEVVETAALQRVFLVLEILDRKREVHLALEPRLDRVLVGGFDIVQVLRHERSDVGGNQLARQVGGVGRAAEREVRPDGDPKGAEQQGRRREPRPDRPALRRGGGAQRRPYPFAQAGRGREAEAAVAQAGAQRLLGLQLAPAFETAGEMFLEGDAAGRVQLVVEVGVQVAGFGTAHVSPPRAVGGRGGRGAFPARGPGAT